MTRPFTPEQLIRMKRLEIMLEAIGEWRRSTCIERDYWRSAARVAIAEFKTRHLIPERLAFETAVARRKVA